MKPEQINASAQILTFAAVVIGLALVVYELRQSARVADATMFNMTTDRVNNRLLARMGDDPRLAMYRASVCPERLSGEDLVALDVMYKLYIISLAHEAEVAETLALERDGQAPIHGIIGSYFDSDPAQRWLRNYLELESPLDSVPGLKDSIRAALAETDASQGTQYEAYAALAGKELSCD